MSDCDNDEIEVELRPFKHQVGGHTCVLEVTRSAICKPYIPREAWFYENEPDELKDFTPKYLGETFVTCDIQDDRKCLVARIPAEIVQRDGPARPEPVLESVLQNTNNTFQKKRRKRPHSESGCSLEAWSSTCIDRQITKYGFWANNQPQKFIILENLVHDYKHPCLMDLKMGRRQFGVDSNEEKRKLLETRCACSTSATLGFRISGSQAYKSKSDSYTFHDKYYGRNLDMDGVVKELVQFFHNGIELRVDVVRQIIHKLETLQSVLLSQKDLFFHSASLLLLYDGANPNNSPRYECNKDNSLECSSSQVSVKSSSEIQPNLKCESRNKSSLKGDESLEQDCGIERSLKPFSERDNSLKLDCGIERSSKPFSGRDSSLKHDCGIEMSSKPSPKSDDKLKPDCRIEMSSKPDLERDDYPTPDCGIKVSSKSVTDLNDRTKPDFETEMSSKSMKISNTAKQYPRSENQDVPLSNTGIEMAKVDVRMIDFAHVSEKFADEEEVESIADDTIVFGLIKLKEILTGFLE